MEDEIGFMPMPAGSRTLSGLRVLIVDDDEAFCRALREILETWGCSVGYCTTASAAGRALKREPADVLLIDYHLNGTDGVELMQALQRDHGKMSTIAISAHENALVEARFLGLGGVAWIRKPFRSSLLVERLSVVTANLA